MIDHFEIRVVRFDECVEFYSKVLLPLKIEKKWSDNSAAGFGEIAESKVRFLIEKSELSTPCHIAFAAPEKIAVDSFHNIGVENGYVVNGKPGIRENYAPNYYASFLFDPDGNNVEALLYV